MKVRISFSKGFFPLLSSSLLMVLCLAGCAEDSRILDDGQSRQLEFSVKTCNWNSSNSSSSDYKPVSRATPITGTTFDTSNSFDLIADQYDGSSYSTLINNEAVSFSNSIWKTSHDYYWSGNSSKTVSFYAYYPASISSSISHTAGSAPTLSYTVPGNATDQIDILASSKTGVAGDSYNQTPVDFKHIFAAVQFSVGSKGLGSGTISSISIGDVHNSGIYTFGSGWTLGTSTKTFTISQPKTISGTSGEDIYSDTYTLMMIPQMISNATVTITYSNGGTLTKTISGTWEAGQTYNYGLSFIREYDYTGNIQSFTAPVTGTYKLEVWGASGGGYVVTAHTQPSSGGLGGYSSGTINLSSGQTIYIYVGGAGTYGFPPQYGGWNGGGRYSSTTTNFPAGSGGGATDMRTIGGDCNNSTSLNSRLIVAGGGGGADNEGGTYNGDDDGSGGAGGGTSGQGIWINGVYDSSYGGTQTSGYALGEGQNAIADPYDSPGAGGGFYGGLVMQDSGNNGAGGGSGNISGVSNGTTIAGNNSIPSHSGSGIMVGNSGNGYARITFISAN